jgi:hypothetical protein
MRKIPGLIMLSNLDVVISFATIMLDVSMLVMAGTQTISALFNIRGAQLKAGLEQLFFQAGLDGSKGRDVANAVVLHPLLSDGVLWKRAAPAIQQRELVQVLGLLKQRNSPTSRTSSTARRRPSKSGSTRRWLASPTASQG